MKSKTVLASAIAALLMAGGAHAATTFTPALSYSGGGQNLSNPPYSLGYEFTTNSDVTVGALGIYQANGSLADDHVIDLWDSAGDLLATTTIEAPDGDVSVAGFDYNAIDPVKLAANENYFIGAEYDTGSDPVLFPGEGGTFSTIPAITYVQSTYGNPTGFDNNAFGTNGFFGPNLGVTAVPEPATWAMVLLGVGMIGGGLRTARRKGGMALVLA
jgi:hypothetical protein